MKMRKLKMLNVDEDVLKLPKANFSLHEMKLLCKKHGISNSSEYKKRYKEVPGLVAHPERMFPDEWVSYNDFFDIPEFYTYEEVVYKIKGKGIRSQSEYKKYVKDLGDPRFPFDPQGAYAESWKNWYKFLGKEEPFNVEFILPEFKQWRVKIDEFMRQALGGSSKKSYLCRFVRVYIERHDGSKSPQEFLTKQKVNIKPFRDELEKFSTDNMRRNVILSVNEFFDYIIGSDLTVEDEETGEVFRLMDARNPFEFMLTDSYVSSPGRSESTKPCLQYHFVRKAQSWIIPESARSFRDLAHLHEFDSDWVKVERHIIDKDDPDCVYKKAGPFWYLWVPTDWVHTFALTKVPLRGRQIAYNDSGEADEYIPVIKDAGGVAWVKNHAEMAGMTKSQSFVKRYPDDQIGMFVTTNKTSSNNGGYSIPWMPEDLAYLSGSV
ncbi:MULTISPECIES: VPA1269 family protein [unclassified Cobetia]|uniref:VPA1269 family protein n=1 Tax=unclassified Cobetia TaxID=2609414 RepID=UPI002098044F|nr:MULTISPECIES: VPA1269 family protein [unclassified Cobetia]MCO7232391.1 VPA1269 family protein [Cobetia sp. Dlab-2-AX]MCO7235232.1 VPA1269 family protein [Cobetia sp. Dlab-2-U]